MPRQLALFLCIAFICWLWYRDNKRRPNLSTALWIPVIWLLVLGSRPLSFWLGVQQDYSGPNADLEGNTFDRTVLLIQIFASFVVLTRRKIYWSEIIRNNKAVFAFYAYLLISIAWADYPFVSFKRWFKDLGSLPVMMIILTEDDPVEAIQTVFFRCAFVLLPLSLVFIKYIPELGRSYSATGEPMYGGVTQQKNALGEIVLIFGLVMVWRLTQLYEAHERKWFNKESRVLWLMLAMGGWLLWMSNSKTSTLCLAVGTALLVGPYLPRSSPGKVLAVALTLLVILMFLEFTIHISDKLLGAIGRDATLTNRTEIWKVIAKHPVDWLFGKGYLMYWDSMGVFEMQGNLVELKTAHNGYLDIYLDGGWIGIGFLVGMLIVLAKRTTLEFLDGTPYGGLPFAFFVIMLFYNISESMYARRTPLWFTFLLFSLNPGVAVERQEVEVDEEELDAEPA